jgi:hypothetical protein
VLPEDGDPGPLIQGKMPAAEHLYREAAQPVHEPDRGAAGVDPVAPGPSGPETLAAVQLWPVTRGLLGRTSRCRHSLHDR